MAGRLSHPSINCTDAFALSEWLEASTRLRHDPNEPGDEECMILDPNGDQRLLFVEGDRLHESPGRIHFDVAPTDRRRDAEIDRVLELGASKIADRRNEDGSGWMVLADPAGNRFCIVRSDDERNEAS